MNSSRDRSLKDRVNEACKVAFDYGDSSAKREALILELLLDISDSIKELSLAGKNIELIEECKEEKKEVKRGKK